MQGEWIYFIRPVGARGPTKIGWSRAPEQRLNEYLTFSPYPLEIVARLRGSNAGELKIHHLLRDHHSHREWFHIHDDVDAVVDAVLAGTFDVAALPDGKRLPGWGQGPLYRSAAA